MHRVLAGAICSLAFSLAAAQQSSPPPAPTDTVTSTTTSPDTAPLPDIQTLLDRVRARYDALESLRKTYVCTMTQVADEFSSNGSKKSHTDTFQVFYVGNTEVLQHISRDGKPLTWFTIAGADGKYVPADAKISGDTVEVSAAKVEKPVAVRFAWAETAQPNFFNGAGLPAEPFRTDEPAK